ncbi:FtsQ-type POTRA domain-containing protein [Patescibacteria group bacterium]|nr:FtsQ-type POTRA domain-containing protein [Patescibacteria group bacterium]
MRKPMRFKRKKKRVSFLKLRSFWYATGVLFFLTFLFYAVVFSSWLEIKEVQVEGAQEVKKEHILAALGEKLWWNWFGIPTNSILLFDGTGAGELLSYKFPLLRAVFVKRSFPQTIVVSVEERVQVGTWCVSLKAGEESLCFALDKEGIAFKEVEAGEGYTLFSSKEASQVALGKESLNLQLLSTLLDFREAFLSAGEPMHVILAAFEIGRAGQVEGVTQEGWKIRLDTEESMEWQQTKLQLVLEQKIPPEKRGELKYIDLRFGDQAYIKYQD